MSSACSPFASGLRIRCCARATSPLTAPSRTRPAGVIATSLARLSSSELRDVTSPRSSRFFDDDGDGGAVERDLAAERRLVEFAGARERGKRHELQGGQVGLATFVEEDRDRDLLAAAQQMSRHRLDRDGFGIAQEVLVADGEGAGVAEYCDSSHCSPAARPLALSRSRNDQSRLAALSDARFSISSCAAMRSISRCLSRGTTPSSRP